MAQFLAVVDWLHSLDGTWVFLLILGFVTAVVVLWSRNLRRNEPGDRIQDE